MRYMQSNSSFRKYKVEPRRQPFWRRFKKRRLAIATEGNAPSLRSPFKQKKPKNWRAKFSLALLIILIITWIGLIIYLPCFQINKISTTGLNVIKYEELKTIVENTIKAPGIFPKNNFFLLNTEKVVQAIQDQYALNFIEIKKIFPDTLQIDLQEKISTLIYDNGSNYYLIDRKGTVIRLLSEVKSSATTFSTATSTTASSTLIHIPEYQRVQKDFGDFPVVYDENRPEISERQENVLCAELINGLISFYTQLEKGGVAKIKYFTLGTPRAGTTAFTNKPWKILLQPLNDVGAQIGGMKILLKDNQPREYIDLRYGEKIYWK